MEYATDLNVLIDAEKDGIFPSRVIESVGCARKIVSTARFSSKPALCRHGDRCSRLHTRPTERQTLILANMYVFPNAALPIPQQSTHFEDFYENVFEELSKHGDIEELDVCDNLSDHMIGNVYVKFFQEEQAAAAKRALSGWYYAERPIVLDFSPVTDFREASCRQYEERACQKGGYCNFLHLKRIFSRELRRKLYGHGRRYEADKGGRSIENDSRRSDRTRRLDRRSSRSRSSPAKNPRNREGSVERRAKIELWNREREEFQASAAAASEHDNGADFRCQEQVQC